jgi:integrase/recombinase XerD
MSVSKIQRIIKRVANQAKVQRPCSPHVLRHTFAVTALQKGVSLAALQRILGHDNLATTAIYLNLSNEEALREFRAKW